MANKEKYFLFWTTEPGGYKVGSHPETWNDFYSDDWDDIVSRLAALLRFLNKSPVHILIHQMTGGAYVLISEYRKVMGGLP